MRVTRAGVFVVLGVAALLVASTASAAISSSIPQNDFQFTVVGGVPVEQEWIEYPQPNDPSWYNVWYPNGGPIDGWKYIWYDMVIGGDNVVVEVAINWSGPNYLDPSEWPQPISGEGDIVRQTIFRGGLSNGQAVPLSTGRPDDTFSSPIPIPDWNPLWVSVDIRTLGGDGDWSGGGTIWHQHVPEPSSFTILAGLLTLGGIGMFVRRRRKAS